MPARLPLRVVADIEAALNEPGPLPTEYIHQIARINSTTFQTVYAIKKRVDRGMAALPLSGGPVPVLQNEHEKALKLLLDIRPWMYLDEIRDFLLEAYDKDVHISTVSRCLARIKVTRKRLKYMAAQRNEELRVDWLDFMQQFTASQVICVDESGSDERNGDRTFGWAHIGARAKVSQWLQYRERWSVLAGYTVDGYLDSTTFAGTCTSDILEDFLIEQLLPQCNPFPQERSVVLLDNASIHHACMQRVQQAYLRKGVWIKFLPPYSPDFNPIEESFGDLKHWIRRNYRRERREFDSYQSFLEYAVKESGTGIQAAARARAHFRNCGMI